MCINQSNFDSPSIYYRWLENVKQGLESQEQRRKESLQYANIRDKVLILISRFGKERLEQVEDPHLFSKNNKCSLNWFAIRFRMISCHMLVYTLQTRAFCLIFWKHAKKSSTDISIFQHFKKLDLTENKMEDCNLALFRVFWGSIQIYISIWVPCEIHHLKSSLKYGKFNIYHLYVQNSIAKWSNQLNASDCL